MFENGDKKKQIQPRAFEQVYAVFDRDDHSTYFDALIHAESLNNKLRNDTRQPVIFKAIASVPSFELWLKEHIPAYEKGRRCTFKETSELLTVATRRAERLAKKFTAYDDPEPYTAVVELVKLLTTLTS